LKLKINGTIEHGLTLRQYKHRRRGHFFSAYELYTRRYSVGAIHAKLMAVVSM